MSGLDGNDQELYLQHAIRQLLKDQLKEDKQERNNSFVFLENSTLNLLITYLLMNRNNPTNGEPTKGINELSQTKLAEELDQIIAESKQGFEEIITLLKEKR